MGQNLQSYSFSNNNISFWIRKKIACTCLFEWNLLFLFVTEEKINVRKIISFCFSFSKHLWWNFEKVFSMHLRISGIKCETGTCTGIMQTDIHTLSFTYDIHKIYSKHVFCEIIFWFDKITSLSFANIITIESTIYKKTHNTKQC